MSDISVELRSLHPELEGDISFGPDQNDLGDNKIEGLVAREPIARSFQELIEDSGYGYRTTSLDEDYTLWAIPHRCSLVMRSNWMALSAVGIDVQYDAGGATCSVVQLWPSARSQLDPSLLVHIASPASSPAELSQLAFANGRLATSEFREPMDAALTSAIGVGSSWASWEFQKAERPLASRDLETWSLLLLPTGKTSLKCKIRLWVRYRTVFVPSRIQSPWVDVACKLVRHSEESVAPIATPRCTILFMAANPTNTQPRAPDREARAIGIELERSGYRDRFVFDTRWAMEPLDLLRELRRIKPAILHCCGPGSAAGLILQSASGNAQLVSAAAIVETLAATAAPIKVIVLNACYSDHLAGELLAHADCVVGTYSAVTDHAARSFATGFYGGLAEHEPVATAFLQGCAALRLEEFHDMSPSLRDSQDLASADRSQADSITPHMRMRLGVDASRLVLFPSEH